MLNIQALTSGIDTYQNRISQSLERLSTGLKLNKASDDPAGMAIAQGLSAQIQGAQQAEMNIGSGQDMLQTAEGGMSSISDALQRMRELAVQSANGSLNLEDRKAISAEYNSLMDQINGTAGSTVFNQKQLLNANQSVTIQTGPNAGDQMSVNLASTTGGALGISGTGVGSQEQAQSAISAIDNALANLSTSRSSVGAAQNTLAFTGQNVSLQSLNLSSALSNIQDADFAAETSALASNKALLQYAVTALNDANQQNKQIINLLA